MKVKLDENMPTPMADLLKRAGHDAATVADEGLSGADDPRVMEAARAEGRILVTFDTDFGNILDYPLGTHTGIVVFRLHDQRWSVLEGPARRLLDARVLERIQGGLAVVDESRIRLRTGRKEETP